MQPLFTSLLEFAGTFAFAISGLRLAARKNIDWFGAFVVGFATAIGGGTVRDLLLGVTPFWMLDAKYILITAVALLVVLVFKSKIHKWSNTLFLFDAIGLGLFTVIGISKCLAAGHPMWVCIIMGTITGVVGGIIRDILLNEVPLILRKDIYALACVAGGIVYYFCIRINLLLSVTEAIAAITVIAVRIVSVKYHIQLPVLKTEYPKHENDRS